MSLSSTGVVALAHALIATWNERLTVHCLGLLSRHARYLREVSLGCGRVFAIGTIDGDLGACTKHRTAIVGRLLRILGALEAVKPVVALQYGYQVWVFFLHGLAHGEGTYNLAGPSGFRGTTA